MRQQAPAYHRDCDQRSNDLSRRFFARRRAGRRGRVQIHARSIQSELVPRIFANRVGRADHKLDHQRTKAQQTQIITNRVLTSILLGATEQMSCSSCGSGFASIGSFAAGAMGDGA